MRDTTSRIAFAPAIVGSLLWAGASALFCEDAYKTGQWTVTTILQPVLTASGVASAVWMHRSLAEWRPLRASGFALLAILASLACLWGTMGKLAEAQDHRTGDAMRANRTLHLKSEELAAARRGATLECGKIGPRCSQWQARVDSLTKEAASLQLVSEDPRADALGRVAGLLGYDAEKVKAIATAITPLLLPVTLELGSILFWAAAFHRRSPETRKVTGNSAPRVYTRNDALADFQSMRRAPSQQALATRWGVSEGCVSKWARAWETSGAIDRRRFGREKACLALPAPS